MEQWTILPCIMTISPLFSLHFTLYLCSYNISYLVFLCTHTTQPLSPFSFSSIYSFFLCLLCHMLISLHFPDTFIVILQTLVPFSTFIVLQYIKPDVFSLQKQSIVDFSHSIIQLKSIVTFT